MKNKKNKKNRIVVNVCPDKVRSMCVDFSYCTRCNNQQYDELLALCTDDVDAERIHAICSKILMYTEVAVLCVGYNCTPDEFYQNILYNVLNRCTYLTIATR